VGTYFFLPILFGYNRRRGKGARGVQKFIHKPLVLGMMTINRYCGSHMRNPSGATLQIFYEQYCHPWTMRQNLTCLKSSVRFAKMFDPKQLPADFRQQLCNLPRPIAARAFKHHLCITGVEGELSEDLGEAPQTPPNTPSHVEPPEAVRRSGKKRPSEGKPEGSPSASPS